MNKVCYRISLRIEQICKSMGIPYKSKHLHKSNFHVDAIKLNDLYCQMKQIVAEVVEIADKHGSEDLASALWRDINMIENVDHDLTKIAKIMDERGKNEKNQSL